MSRTRKSNFELLRIVAILMVIMSHFVVHGGIKNTESAIDLNTIMVKMMILGAVANHIFIIMSGYFLARSHINIEKVVQLFIVSNRERKKILKFIYSEIQHSVVPIRPGRSNPRFRKHKSSHFPQNQKS